LFSVILENPLVYLGNRDDVVFFETLVIILVIVGKIIGSFWEMETLAFKLFVFCEMVAGIYKYRKPKLVFSRTGSKRSNSIPFCDDVGFQEFQKS
jgi:hypothetical protein